jgi:hypothetical protein
MLKQIKPNHLYMIIDIKEPYIEKLFEILKAGQIEKDDWPEGKDITFKEWIFQTFGQEGLDYLNTGNSVN